MLLKIAGSAAVLLACAGFGFFAASEVERREQQLRSLYASFLLIQGDIRYRKSSLPEAVITVFIHAVAIGSGYCGMMYV